MERDLLRPKLMLSQDIYPEDMVMVDMDAMDMERDLLRPKLMLSQDIYQENMVMVDMDSMDMERDLLRPQLMLSQDISLEDMVMVDLEAMDMVVMDLDLEDIEEVVDMGITAMGRDLLRLKLNQVTYPEDMVLEGTEVMDWDMEDITATADLEDIMVNYLEAKSQRRLDFSELYSLE